MWKPLNCLVEAANRTKGFKFTIQGGSIAKTEQIHDHGGEVNAHKTKGRENANKSDDKKGVTLASSESIKTRRFHGTRRKRGAASKGLSTSAQALLNASGLKRDRRMGPIWLSLVASDDQCVAISNSAIFNKSVFMAKMCISIIYMGREREIPLQ